MPKIVLLAVTLALVVSGCKNGSSPQASVNQGSGPTATSATPGAGQASAPGAGQASAPGAGQASTPGAGQGAPAAGLPSRQGLLGVYSISEVDHQVGNKNAVDMIPAHREIQLSFRSDGSFMRVAWRQGLIALTETGTFKIDYPDQLVLLPTEVNKKTITDGRKTSYKFALSTDGDELRLWGARGNVAVFQRIKTF